MAPGLHGSARTTPRVRAELQKAQEATRSFAARHGLNPRTVANWRDGRQVARAPHDRRPADGPDAAAQLRPGRGRGGDRRRVRRRTLLPLDDALGCLRWTIPKLSR